MEYAPIVTQQESEFPHLDSGLTFLMFKQGDDPINAINHMMSFQSAIVTSRFPTPNNQTLITHNVSYQADNLNAYDSGCDELNTTKVALMANLSHYGLNALVEVHNPDNVDNDFEKRFVSQIELSAEQAFWSQNSMNFSYPNPFKRPTKVDVPKELPKVSMCLKLETGLLNRKDFIENETYDKLFQSYTTLEKHCISLEVDTQLNQEIFQRDNSVSNQSAPSFDQYFELNELKAQSQEKYTVISKLKKRIKSLSGNVNKDNVKKDIEKIETINIELDHREQGLIIAALRDALRKLKGKAIVDTMVSTHTIDPSMLKVDAEPIASRLLNNRTVHSDYLWLTQEQAAILREIVEQGKSQYPLNNSLDHALGNVCPLTKITTTTEVPSRKPTALETDIPKPVITLVYSRKPRKSKTTDHIRRSKRQLLPHVALNTVPSCVFVTFRTRAKTYFFNIICTPSRNDWDLLFQPLFDELLTLPLSVNPPAPEVIALITDVIPPEQAESTGSPSSTIVDQDAPSPSKSQTTPETQSHVIPQDVEEDIHDIEVAHMGNDPLFGMPIPEVTSDQSSLTVQPQTIMHPNHQIS
nr:hypothetical protein [Tanacetum cinerariifolium]